VFILTWFPAKKLIW